MTKQEIAVLGHAFFDGKTLQYCDDGMWVDWVRAYCPHFTLTQFEFRIKPGETKTITICTFIHEGGAVTEVVQGSHMAKEFFDFQGWTHIKSLDQVVEVE